jgi:hypothetical protein
MPIKRADRVDIGAGRNPVVGHKAATNLDPHRKYANMLTACVVGETGDHIHFKGY